MSKPILTLQNTFDALLEHKMDFTFVGDQVFKNRLVVNRSDDNTVVYDTTQTSFQLYHIISANVLSNGIDYTAKLSVFNKDNIESEMSDSVVFSCRASPHISINIEQNAIIKNSTVNVIVTYETTDDEYLNTWQIELLDYGKNRIHLSEVQYATQSMGMSLNGLETNHQYYVRCFGTTIGGMAVDTGLIVFSVTYVEPNTFCKTILTNLPNSGSVKVESHLIGIDGKSSPTPPLYVDGNAVDLTIENSNVWFDDGFKVKGDFSQQIILRNPTPYTIVHTATNGRDVLNIWYMLGSFEEGQKGYFLLEVLNDVLSSRIATCTFDVLQASEFALLLVRRINDLWKIVYINNSITGASIKEKNLTVKQWNDLPFTIRELRLNGNKLLDI